MMLTLPSPSSAPLKLGSRRYKRKGMSWLFSFEPNPLSRKKPVGTFGKLNATEALNGLSQSGVLALRNRRSRIDQKEALQQTYLLAIQQNLRSIILLPVIVTSEITCLAC